MIPRIIQDTSIIPTHVVTHVSVLLLSVLSAVPLLANHITTANSDAVNSKVKKLSLTVMPMEARAVINNTPYPVSLREDCECASNTSNWREVTTPNTKIGRSGDGLETFTPKASFRTGGKIMISKKS